MTRSQPQTTPTSTQAARSRGLRALIRMAVQDAIREERAAMAEASATQAAAAKQGAQQ